MTAKGATGIGNNIFCKDFTHAILHFDTDGGGDAALTAKLVGSVKEDCPDFTAAQTMSNSYDFIQMKDLEDGSSIDGDIGFVVVTADNHRIFEVNVNGLNWLNVRITARTQGELTVFVTLYNSQ